MNKYLTILCYFLFIFSLFSDSSLEDLKKQEMEIQERINLEVYKLIKPLYTQAPRDLGYK